MSQPNISHKRKGLVTYTIAPWGVNFTSGYADFKVPNVPRVERAWFIQAMPATGSLPPGTVIVGAVQPISGNTIRISLQQIGTAPGLITMPTGTINYAITFGVEY